MEEAWGDDDLFSNYFSKCTPTPYTAYTIATSQESGASREVRFPVTEAGHTSTGDFILRQKPTPATSQRDISPGGVTKSYRVITIPQEFSNPISFRV